MAGFKTDQTEVTIDEGLAYYRARTDAAIAHLSSKGFGEPQIPMMQTDQGIAIPYQGTLPPDITVLTDDQLGVYMGRLTEWSSYVGFQYAIASSKLTGAQTAMELVEAKLRTHNKLDEDNKKRSNPERDDLVRTDRRFIEAHAEVVYWEVIHRYLKAINENAQNAYAAISRRVTQRGQDVERERRTTSANHMPAGGPVFGGPRHIGRTG